MFRKKYLAVLLAALMAVLPLAACNTEKADQTVSPDAGAESGVDEKYTLELPAESYSDKEFVILCEGGAGSFWANDEDTWLGEDSDDGVKSAIYKRIQLMKQEYGINVVVKRTASTTDDLHKSITSGDNAYNAVFALQSRITSSAANGDLMDLFEAENINMSKGYWDQNIPDLLSISNQLFFTAGDILTMEERASWVMTFNKKMAAAHGVPDLYELVKNGEWTLDKFNELCANVSNDDNGDGIMDHTDTYALATHNDNALGFFYSSGLRFVVKDKDDIPVLNVAESDKILKVMEKTAAIQETDDKMMNAHDWIHINNHPEQLILAAFMEDRALFYAEVLDAVIGLRDMDTDFGILPLPKYEEGGEYITFVNPAGSFVGIPKSEQDRDGGYFASYALEAMAYLGHKHITPQFIEKAVMGKTTRDDESVAMLKIIFGNRTYDLGLICDFGGVAGAYSTAANKGEVSLTTVFKRNQKKAESEINDFISKIKK